MIKYSKVYLPHKMYKGHTITAIIPAYNEASRIGQVLKPTTTSKYLDEIIVIDDGSTDSSSSIVKRFSPQVKLVILPNNRGKAAAVFAGIQASKSEVVFLLDADLSNLRPSHIDKCIVYFVNHNLDMLLLPYRVSRPIQNAIAYALGSHILFTGQRIIKKNLITLNKFPKKIGYGLEIYLNHVSQDQKWTVDIMPWPNDNLPTLPPKIVKQGLQEGIKNDIKMLKEMTQTNSGADYFSQYQQFVVKTALKNLLNL